MWRLLQAMAALTATGEMAGVVFEATLPQTFQV